MQYKRSANGQVSNDTQLSQGLPTRGRIVGRSGYAHILVPSISGYECPTLTLGLELAAAHGAALTLLHVFPPEAQHNSVHWLDAINQLHQALHRQNGKSPSHNGHNPAEAARSEILTFLEREIPERLLDQVDVRVECRAGDVADEVARFADESTVDLVIMSSGPQRWWLPILPAQVRRVIRQTRKQVALVSPDAHPYVFGGNGSPPTVRN